MTAFVLSGSGWEWIIFLMIFFGIIVPLFLFIFGFIKYAKDKKQGKIILIIATLYTIIGFGICGGFGF
ncbi:hypothetical protein [Psychroserpens algicola]|uniref:Uncharacterized protein n=1 Tax=Psychroserpens algicola TaxID=1719034 RepID=A0ABT0H7S4_9FLAO|nr:hypothetical protein [Psychroserpens algicola]MCK8480405.1 hypothetical protein [Psychroserpens algicola]